MDDLLASAVVQSPEGDSSSDSEGEHEQVSSKQKAVRMDDDGSGSESESESESVPDVPFNMDVDEEEEEEGGLSKLPLPACSSPKPKPKPEKEEPPQSSSSSSSSNKKKRKKPDSPPGEEDMLKKYRKVAGERLNEALLACAESDGPPLVESEISEADQKKAIETYHKIQGVMANGKVTIVPERTLLYLSWFYKAPLIAEFLKSNESKEHPIQALPRPLLDLKVERVMAKEEMETAIGAENPELLKTCREILLDSGKPPAHRVGRFFSHLMGKKPDPSVGKTIKKLLSVEDVAKVFQDCSSSNAFASSLDWMRTMSSNQSIFALPSADKKTKKKKLKKQAISAVPPVSPAEKFETPRKADVVYVHCVLVGAAPSPNIASYWQEFAKGLPPTHQLRVVAVESISGLEDMFKCDEKDSALDKEDLLLTIPADSMPVCTYELFCQRMQRKRVSLTIDTVWTRTLSTHYEDFLQRLKIETEAMSQNPLKSVVSSLETAFCAPAGVARKMLHIQIGKPTAREVWCSMLKDRRPDDTGVAEYFMPPVELFFPPTMFCANYAKCTYKTNKRKINSLTLDESQFDVTSWYKTPLIAEICASNKREHHSFSSFARKEKIPQKQPGESNKNMTKTLISLKDWIEQVQADEDNKAIAIAGVASTLFEKQGAILLATLRCGWKKSEAE